MHKTLWILLSLVLFSMLSIALLQGSQVALPKASAEISGVTKQRLLKAYGDLPLSFEANEGQTDRQVRFLSRGAGYTLFLTGKEAVLALQKRKSEGKGQKARGKNEGLARTANPEPRTPSVLRMKLLGANAAPQVSGLDELPSKSNYFIGNDPKKWLNNVRNYAKVRYLNVYPGVDLIYYGNQRQLEYDFVVAPGADPNAIKLNFRGAEGIRLDEKGGDLVLSIGGGQVRFGKPRAYQRITSDDGPQTTNAISGKHYIDADYVLKGTGGVEFRVPGYDASKPLVIDPALVFSTDLGGNNADNGTGIAVDASGNAYVAGDTASVNFPTTLGAFQTTCGGCPTETNAFVTKLDPTGSTLIFSTYLGGAGSDEGLGIAVDSSGSAYVTGETFSSNFPTTPGAFQTTLTPGTCGVPPDTFQCPNAFVTKLDPTGSSLLYSTYLGGSQANFGFGIAVNTSGSAYVTGSTSASDFPTTPGAFQTTFGGGTCFGRPCPDAFVAKIDPSQSGAASLVYSTYLGGSNEDAAVGIALDASNNAYVAGYTLSTNFPITLGAFQTTLGSGTCGTFPCVNAFVTKFDPAGSVQIYSTYLGGNNEDAGMGIALDASGNAYVTGTTSSANFPTTPGAFQTTFGGGTCGIPPDTFPCVNAFVTKLNPPGSGLAYSTYLGGSGDNRDDQGNGIAVDISGNAYVTGATNSTNFPLVNPIQGTYGGGPADAFVSELNAAGSGLVSSTYLGGSNDDQGNGIALDSSNNAYVVGSTNSANFPTTPGAFQTTFGGGICGTAPCNDAFILKISP